VHEVSSPEYAMTTVNRLPSLVFKNCLTLVVHLDDVASQLITN